VTAYRDENEALRAKLTHLEDELAAERAHVARLKGLVEAGPPKKVDALVGEAVHHVDETELEGVLPQEALEAMARVVRSRGELEVSVQGELGAGSGAAVTGRARGLSGLDGPKSFSLERGAGSTKLRLETDLRNLPVAVALGPVLGGLSSLPYVLYQMDLLHHFEPGESLGSTMSVAAAFTVCGTIAARWLAQRRARRLRERHQGLWATVLELAREHIEAPVRARVAEPNEDEVDGDEERGGDASRMRRPGSA
jgi:hypothetical protein